MIVESLLATLPGSFQGSGAGAPDPAPTRR